jgi:hypothetical protein
MGGLGLRLWGGVRRRRSQPALLCLLASLACALCGGTLLWQDRRAASEMAGRSAMNIAMIAAQEIAGTIGQHDLALQAAARALAVPGIGDLVPEPRPPLALERVASLPFGFLNVLNEAGDVVADLQSRPLRPANFASRAYFRELRDDPRDRLFIDRPVLTAGGAMVPLARRRALPDGSFAGVVVGSMRLSQVEALFAPLDLGSGGTVTLLRSDGLVLMRTPGAPDDIGRTISSGTSVFRALSAGWPVVRAVDPDRITRLTILRPVADLPLVVAVGLAEADI